MEEIFSRTKLLLGNDNMQKLQNAHVAIFGLGGVGSYVAEALCRSGIYNFTLFDNDIVAPSNINRQLVALHSTIGKLKTEVMKNRMLDINPNAKINIFNCFYLPENADNFPLDKYSYIVDAIDTVTAKICLISRAKRAKVPIISSMGAGNKLNPCSFVVCDIKDTTVCPLAKVMRKELKALGIEGVKVVYSKELSIKQLENKDLNDDKKVRKQTPGSIAFVPSVAGLIIAGEVIKDLII